MGIHCANSSFGNRKAKSTGIRNPDPIHLIIHEYHIPFHRLKPLHQLKSRGDCPMPICVISNFGSLFATGWPLGRSTCSVLQVLWRVLPSKCLFYLKMQVVQKERFGFLCSNK
ncbi:hypothetical protein O6H91_01G137200 [Diphasiastrum complanatum]|uniref:Uncharacterized protein n=1 Tax=Diphasiastrum complanatum TaxID=34168 RepID=A0ACC2EWW6_DIPCM|nr:hypothetical protein O6H91_01G137200 [Diphasiastrum complanatum]